ncbi:spermidine synthase [Streptoalloteichus tenebrarius]|uniref:Polyamine aminopropyltransferase n=2 Tax=Streptoalloteichus tenebrarius (strain ATCC 17920 / DSM 40477 / JCM 4838 / CBS 697.72 / NBRC 16177 / NCIMB 11028 / NRRL B-12390 / A12253. 1 / ISP 5477) TaxID=1933 RepID=A0ABT1I2P9_STRSD|nr:spermidine synthase [Streptoalloteichus tenebrarius]BFF01299.1 spermidine synthase [Streptoalloteichus tenebrarius]
MIEIDGGRYVREPLAKGMFRLWQVHDVLFEGDTAYQHVLIARTDQGVSLFCDDDRQSTEFSQLVYHEALLVPALLLADKVENVLVVGSSEGVVSQISVAFGATRVDHVDIDEQAVKLCARHLPYGYTPEELERAERGEGPVRVHYTDGWQYLLDAAKGDVRYDIVLVDLPDERDDEEAQHNRLYGEEFLRMCKAVLAPGGVVVTQAGCQTMWRNTTLIRSWNRFQENFGTTVYYGSDEHEWAYLFGRADEVADTTELMIERLEKSAYRPVSIDADALRGNTIPPYLVRRG